MKDLTGWAIFSSVSVTKDACMFVCISRDKCDSNYQCQTGLSALLKALSDTPPLLCFKALMEVDGKLKRTFCVDARISCERVCVLQCALCAVAVCSFGSIGQ